MTSDTPLGGNDNPSRATTRAPSLFLAHGAPPLLDDADWLAELAQWGSSLGKPRALLVVSAHWSRKPVSIGTTTVKPLVYDFYGFPERYYKVTYASPGAPDVASRVEGALDAVGIAHRRDEARGLDHGVYVPLIGMYPKADVPVLQVSLPGGSAADALRVGEALAPLRDEGVAIVGSGFLTHNLRAIGRDKPSWAVEFDSWVKEAIAARDVDGLVDFAARAPGANLAHPTDEHYLPLLCTMGAASSSEPLSTPIDGFWMGSFSRRSIQLG